MAFDFLDSTYLSGIPSLDALLDGLASIYAIRHSQAEFRKLYSPVEGETGVLLLEVLDRSGVAELLEGLSGPLGDDRGAAMTDMVALDPDGVAATGARAVVSAFGGDGPVFHQEHREQHDGVRFEGGAFPEVGHLPEAESLVVRVLLLWEAETDLCFREDGDEGERLRNLLSPHEGETCQEETDKEESQEEVTESSFHLPDGVFPGGGFEEGVNTFRSEWGFRHGVGVGRG